MFIGKVTQMLAGYISSGNIKLAVLEEDAALIDAASSFGKCDKFLPSLLKKIMERS